PKDRCREGARRCRVDERFADPIDGEAELTGPFSVDVDVERRVVERKRDVHIAQRRDLRECIVDPSRKSTRVAEALSRHAHLDWGGCPEVQDLRDDVTGLEREVHFRIGLREPLPESLFELWSWYALFALKLREEDCVL